MNYEYIGNQIRYFRMKRKISQETMAEVLGLSRQHFGAVERGEKTPSLETIVQISNYLEVSLEDILGESVAKREKEVDFEDCSDDERSILVENMNDLKRILHKYIR